MKIISIPFLFFMLFSIIIIIIDLNLNVDVIPYLLYAIFTLLYKITFEKNEVLK